MATTGHCAYCFEVLAASLQDREPLSYQQVQDSWREYQSLIKPTAEKAAEQDGKEPGVPGDAPDDEEDSDMEEVDSEDDPEGEQAGEESKSTTATLQLPSISRLQAPSSSSPSSTSSSSTPSSLSATSSQAALNTASKSSSNSSFFSFNRSKQPSPTIPPKEEAHPLFVTWNTLSSRGHKSLRGCIGTFDAQNLSTGLKSYALTAAFDDTRFPPISPPELPHLSNSTTLLTNFHPAQNPLDWTLGTHGIRIAFTHHGKRYSATYLPDVALEQGWTKEETLTSLMRKAGLSSGSRVRGWKDLRGPMEVVRYEGSKRSLGWEEWRRWREWVRKQGQHGVR